MIISKFDEAEAFETLEGVMKPIFASETLAVMYLATPTGLKVRPHSHPNDGVLILTSGSVNLLSSEPATLKPGDLPYIPANTEVGSEYEEDSNAIIISVPSRYKNVEEFREFFGGLFGA